MRYLLVILTAVATAYASQAQNGEGNVRHIPVIKESGRFSGWPANHGIWSWGSEIVVGFKPGFYKKNPSGGHAIDQDRPSERKLARSLDGGETWNVEVPGYADHDDTGRDPATIQDGINFLHPDLALRFKGGIFHYSLDRCRTWQGPYTLPTFGRAGLLSRTDYIVEGKDRVTVFTTAQKESGGEGQPLCIRTTDGGRTWHLVGWIGPQPPAGYGYAIMPATVALKGGGYLSMIRRGGIFDGEKRWWLEAFLSPDDGRSWYMLDQPRIDNAGNPATLTRLDSGAIAMTYGWRHAPYGIRARISQDEGQTWGPEIILRCDGASWDLGYPRTVQRPDGKCVTVYYFHHPEQQERYIACTIWDPHGDYDD